jgi:hypothetical protein
VTEFSLVRVEDSRGIEEVVTEVRDFLVVGNTWFWEFSGSTFVPLIELECSNFDLGFLKLN